MRTLSASEKRTVRLGALVIGIYLILFCGFQMRKYLEQKRAAYLRVVRQANALKLRIQPYQERVQLIQKLMDGFHMDPAKLSRATVVGEASAAIQRAATSSGIQVGPVSESPARGGAKELSLVFEGTGQVQAVVGLLNRLETTGYPLIVESVQISAEASRPGQVKMKLNILVLDFEQWKAEAPHA